MHYTLFSVSTIVQVKSHAAIVHVYDSIQGKNVKYSLAIIPFDFLSLSLHLCQAPSSAMHLIYKDIKML